MTRSQQPALTLFAVGMIGLGVLALVYGDFALVWQPVATWVPGRIALAYLSGAIMLVGGAGLLFDATVRWSTRILFPYLIVWTLLKVPALVVAPKLEAVWLGFGELAVLLARPEGAPPILVHHLKHNKVLHEQVVLLTVSMLNTPTRGDVTAIDVSPVSAGFYRVIARFGFMESPDVMGALRLAREQGLDWRDDDTTFYLADLTLLASEGIGMPVWRDKLFVFLSRNARRATNFFQVPADRVVEIGIQLEI